MHFTFVRRLLIQKTPSFSCLIQYLNTLLQGYQDCVSMWRGSVLNENQYTTILVMIYPTWWVGRFGETTWWFNMTTHEKGPTAITTHVLIVTHRTLCFNFIFVYTTNIHQLCNILCHIKREIKPEKTQKWKSDTCNS